MKRFKLAFLFLSICIIAFSQEQYKKPVTPTKNVILMIPDGTSTSALSLARWYQIYTGRAESLSLDPYICGLVKTHGSNSPIVCSAPAMSAYVTGVPQQSSSLSVYPKADPNNDLYPIDNRKHEQYQPLATILEAAKQEKQKATGLVVTSEFPHATPAACASHHYNRNAYNDIVKQMANNKLDVMFGGGTTYLTKEAEDFLKKEQTLILKDDIAAFRSFNEERKIWALFCNNFFPYDLDRNNKEVPSLAEMTQKAIEILSKNENGFFLMVEGSQIDWAGHANDATAYITELIAFDKAVEAAINFAIKDRETTIVILPDHGNSAITAGNRNYKNYTNRPLDDLFGNISKYQKTSRGLEEILLKTQPENFNQVFSAYTGFDLDEEELELLLRSQNYKEGNYMEVANNINMVSSLAKILNSRTHFGFISSGHTTEDVFLAAYHPQGEIPNGLNTNVEINHYLSDVMGLENSLEDLTNRIFAKHTEVFEGLKYNIKKTDNSVELEVKKGRKTLRVPANSSVAYLNGQAFDLGSVAVYIDKNDTFYLPKNLIEKL